MRPELRISTRPGLVSARFRQRSCNQPIIRQPPAMSTLAYAVQSQRLMAFIKYSNFSVQFHPTKGQGVMLAPGTEMSILLAYQTWPAGCPKAQWRDSDYRRYQ